MMPFETNKNYSFNTRAPAILGPSYTNVRVSAILDYQTALMLDNVEAKQRSVYPYLASLNIPDRPDQYTYILFVDSEKNKHVIALEWIDISSINETYGISINVTLNNVAFSDVSLIRETLISLGYTSYNIQIN